jgi:hypothetical protein
MESSPSKTDVGTCRISLDAEMLGGIVGFHSIVEIGACNIEPKETIKKFSVLIQPAGGSYEYGARRVLRRPYSDFQRDGIDPRDAAHQFIEFLNEVSSGKNVEIICVNPGFDFGFLKNFLHTHCSDTVGVIGYKAFDITSYMCAVFGLPVGSMSTGKAWKIIQAQYPRLYEQYYPGEASHSATQDAVDQAMLLIAAEKIVAIKNGWESSLRKAVGTS